MRPEGASRGKKPHDIDRMLRSIEEAVRPWPKAALFELADEGYRSAFEVLVACIVSIRTLDETTVEVARRLFHRARTPEQMCALSPQDIDALLRPSRFHESKAQQILDIARHALGSYDGEIPCELDALLAFRGVGPKCAHLTLGIACREPSGIGVDVHVHRVTNRWGYVHTETPEGTQQALEQKLPRRHWLRINALLVPFGKHVCTRARPHCSTCPVLDRCQQVGVENPR